MAPSHFVSDYEELFGKKPDESAPAEAIATKVVKAPETATPAAGTVAEVK